MKKVKVILCGKEVEKWRAVCQGRCQRARDLYKLCHLPAPQQADVSAGSFLLSPWDSGCACATLPAGKSELVPK